MRRLGAIAIVCALWLALAGTALAARTFAIGDSVMLGAKPELEKRGITVSATVSRRLDDGISILRSMRADGTLPKRVVVHLGTNGLITSSQFAQLMDVLSKTPVVVVLTMKEPRSWEGANNAVIRTGVKGHPNVRLLDWHWWGNRNPGWFWDDGIHLRPEGASAYARLVAKKLR
jgi:lysophospholipase L1-like esterase